MYRTSTALIALLFAGTVSAEPVNGREADRPWVDPNNYQGDVLAAKQGALREARIANLLDGREGDRAILDDISVDVNALMERYPTASGAEPRLYQQVREARERGDYMGSK